MRLRACDLCATAVPPREMVRIGEKTVCRACAERSGSDAPPQAVNDPTVCSVCGLDNGDADLPVVMDLPVCPKCEVRLRHRPFPAWVLLAAAAVPALLAFSFVRADPVFRAKLALTRAERLVSDKKYIEAGPLLEDVLRIAPDSRGALLLKIETDLLADNMKDYAQERDRLLARGAQGPLADRVKGLIERFQTAYGHERRAKAFSEKRKTAEELAELDAARQAFPEGARFHIAFLLAQAKFEFDKGMELGLEEKPAEALPHFETAHQIFPQNRIYHVGLLRARSAAAFAKKDYYTYMSAAEELARLDPGDPQAQTMHANALATRYALTGDESLRKRVAERLEASKALCRTESDRTSYEEFRERIEYRVASREIIDRKEYDRRFRQKK